MKPLIGTVIAPILGGWGFAGWATCLGHKAVNVVAAELIRVSLTSELCVRPCSASDNRQEEPSASSLGLEVITKFQHLELSLNSLATCCPLMPSSSRHLVFASVPNQIVRRVVTVQTELFVFQTSFFIFPNKLVGSIWVKSRTLWFSQVPPGTASTSCE